MSVKQVNYGKWSEAWEVASGDARLVVVTEIGPRILSLTLGDGPNLLFEDEDGELGVGDWKIYGGHRYWISPETTPTYAPDNSRCEADVSGDSLVVTAPSDPNLGCQKTMMISPADNGFRVRHILRNVSNFLLPPGAIWALTCVRPTGRCAVPWRSGPNYWNVATIKLWSKWADHGTNLASAQWKPTNDLYEVHPTGEEGKIGTFCDQGWLGQWTDEATFIKQVAVAGGAAYPDGGCNIELYTCEHFIELETLSPIAIPGPGESVTHDERWFVVPPMEMTSGAVGQLLGR